MLLVIIFVHIFRPSGELIGKFTVNLTDSCLVLWFLYLFLLIECTCRGNRIIEQRFTKFAEAFSSRAVCFASVSSIFSFA